MSTSTSSAPPVATPWSSVTTACAPLPSEPRLLQSLPAAVPTDSGGGKARAMTKVAAAGLWSSGQSMLSSDARMTSESSGLPPGSGGGSWVKASRTSSTLSKMMCGIVTPAGRLSGATSNVSPAVMSHSWPAHGPRSGSALKARVTCSTLALNLRCSGAAGGFRTPPTAGPPAPLSLASPAGVAGSPVPSVCCMSTVTDCMSDHSKCRSAAASASTCDASSNVYEPRATIPGFHCRCTARAATATSARRASLSFPRNCMLSRGAHARRSKPSRATPAALELLPLAARRSAASRLPGLSMAATSPSGSGGSACASRATRQHASAGTPRRQSSNSSLLRWADMVTPPAPASAATSRAESRSASEAWPAPNTRRGPAQADEPEPPAAAAEAAAGGAAARAPRANQEPRDLDGSPGSASASESSSC
mmetsp:Transcript_28462/g.91916  ORF Transcript_28462/g.91916 Transcript_28462/m.91916 type:complete len:422 (-) Transcript_28462:410-1675(-)